MKQSNGKNELPKKAAPETKFDLAKWLLITAIAIAAIVANNVYAQVAWAIRAAVGIIVLFVLAAIALQTTKGKQAWAFVKAARQELRKVVWPTRQETVQTGLIVCAAVVVTALILWGVDSVFISLISWVAG